MDINNIELRLKNNLGDVRYLYVSSSALDTR